MSKRSDEATAKTTWMVCARNMRPHWEKGLARSRHRGTRLLNRVGAPPVPVGSHASGHAPVGVLADFLEVETRYEGVVEDFLRDELNYIVVKSWDAADEGLRLLRSDVDGRATFLVHPEDSQAKFSFVLDESCHCAPPEPSRGSSEEHDSRAGRIRQVAGSDSAEAARRLHRARSGIGRELALENPDAFFLSQSGECFHNVTVTGGKQRSEGPLSMKRELREVLRQLENWTARCARKRPAC